MFVFSLSAFIGGAAIIWLGLLARQRKELDIPRVGPKSGLLGNTTKSYFFSHSLQLIQEGYARVRHFVSRVYALANNQQVQGWRISTVDNGYGPGNSLKKIHERL
jgi:hypothetical protein